MIGIGTIVNAIAIIAGGRRVVDPGRAPGKD